MTTTHERAAKEKVAATREGHLHLYQRLQETLNELSLEMLGNKEWDTTAVDRELDDMLESLNDYFGED